VFNQNAIQKFLKIHEAENNLYTVFNIIDRLTESGNESMLLRSLSGLIVSFKTKDDQNFIQYCQDSGHFKFESIIETLFGLCKGNYQSDTCGIVVYLIFLMLELNSNEDKPILLLFNSALRQLNSTDFVSNLQDAILQVDNLEVVEIGLKILDNILHEIEVVDEFNQILIEKISRFIHRLDEKWIQKFNAEKHTDFKMIICQSLH